MVYQPGIPTGTVTLDVDYQNLQDNFRQLDTTFGVDHYKFSDNTSNNGFHNKVTTPVYAEDPPTTAPPSTSIDPVFYGFQQYPALGVLQYSRGPNDAVPTPLTTLQSSDTPIVLVNTGRPRVNVLDFTGITYASFNFCAINTTNGSPYTSIRYVSILWNGAAFLGMPTNIQTSEFIGITSSGNILQIYNNIIPALVDLVDVYWTIQFIRVK